MKKCYDCTHVEMCGWRKEVEEQGCEFFGDGIVWIPVSERLPEKSKQVMCCDKQGRVFTSAMTYINSNGEPSFGKHYGVIAWMPLPEPYKGGEKK